MPAYPPASATAGPDMYDDQAPPDRGEMGRDQMKEHEDDAQTGVLPKEFFGEKELKPGTVCEVRIERVMDNEVMVSYLPHKDGQEEEPPPEDQAERSAPGPAPSEPSMFD